MQNQSKFLKNIWFVNQYMQLYTNWPNSQVVFLQHTKLLTFWSTRWDLNSRIDSFADCAIRPLWYLCINLAESIGFEPMRRFRNDSLANCSFNHSGNSPNFGGSGEIRTHGPFLVVCFQDRCNKPGSATLPIIGRGYWIRTNDDGFKDRCLRPDLANPQQIKLIFKER